MTIIIIIIIIIVIIIVVIIIIVIIVTILGFHVMSQALLKSVSAMLVSLRCQIYANNSVFLQ